jgi:RNA polymerase sigma-70 factor (ECF subfamily)
MREDAEQLLRQARDGDTEALGRLLDLHQHYLNVIARVQIGQRLQGKTGASDIVQETFLDAHRNFPLFQGTTEAEFVAWLRKILAANLTDLLRRYLGAQGRDVRLEREIADAVDRSSAMLDRGLIATGSSPSQQTVGREQALLLADALDQLPADYRDVLVLRHLQELTFPEIAARMGRSVDSVEKLWMRGLSRLRQALGSSS